MRQLVDDHDLGRACDDGVDIHLLERHSPICDLAARNELQIAYLRCCLGATVDFDESNDHIDPAPAKIVCFLKHAESLSHSRRRSDVDLELAALAALEQLDEFRGLCPRGLPPLDRYCLIHFPLVEILGHAAVASSEGKSEGSYEKRVGCGCAGDRIALRENGSRCPASSHLAAPENAWP